MPKSKGYAHTGRNAGDHKGGRGDMKSYTKPMYPYGPEGVAKTTSSPNYPRSNFASSKGRGSDSYKGMGGSKKY